MFPQNAIGDTSNLIQNTDSQYELHHKAVGASLFRYSGDYGRTWTAWKSYESTSMVPSSIFKDDKRHLIVNVILNNLLL